MIFSSSHFPVYRTVRQYSLGGAPLYYYSYRHRGSFSLPMAVGVWEVSLTTSCVESIIVSSGGFSFIVMACGVLKCLAGPCVAFRC